LAQILKHLNFHIAAVDVRTNTFLFTPTQAHLSHGQQSILSIILHVNSTTGSKGRQGEQCSGFRSKGTAKKGRVGVRSMQCFGYLIYHETNTTITLPPTLYSTCLPNRPFKISRILIYCELLYFIHYSNGSQTFLPEPPEVNDSRTDRLLFFSPPF